MDKTSLLSTIRNILDISAYTEDVKIYFIIQELAEQNYVTETEKTKEIKH